MLKPGQRREFVIIRDNGQDREIRLSLKQIEVRRANDVQECMGEIHHVACIKSYVWQRLLSHFSCRMLQSEYACRTALHMAVA